MPDESASAGPDAAPTTTPIGELFHTGIVVDDLDAAMELLTRIAGLTWASPQVVGGLLDTPEGPLFREVRVTYSLQGPHRVELIEQRDATAWKVVPGGRRNHHLGFWVDDLETGMQRFAELGLAASVKGIGPDGRPIGPTFHRHEASGLWFELIETAYRPAMLEWWSGGGLAVPGNAVREDR